MAQCKQGNKPTIKYQFSGGGEKIFKAEKSPIEIVTGNFPVNAEGGVYNPTGYQIRYFTSQAGGIVTRNVVAHETHLRVTTGFYYVTYILCGNTTYPLLSNCAGSEYWKCRSNAEILDNGLNSLEIINTPCSSPQTNKCSIKVLYEGQILFSDQGNCPLTYTVQCGNCDSDECECEKTVYPGYCCVDCAGLKSSIQSITNEVKRLQ